ncbi:glutamate receptor ionotropic, NMDA 2C-like [Galendromus occidentalis]|uniref:Glutamate receptor ionotropic, NMDA 2C-like n=1 Tax=Galendromus occidentalis TaxID=34638 RepID=A0AAJ7PB51_9ACAR|nr:glutamate receptor ionotropic, NMDA 2C-like [Galendromus occidentalis]
MSETGFETACLECGFIRHNNVGRYTYIPSVKGLTLHVGYIENAPHFLVKQNRVTGQVQEDKGTEVQMLRMFSRYFNFTYKLHPEPNSVYGSRVEKNGRSDWNGLIGWVYHKKMDLSLSELGLSFFRLAAVTFTWPYICDVITYAYPEPRNRESYAAIIWAFQGLTWTAICACVLLNTLIIKLFRGPTVCRGAMPGFWLLLALLARQSSDGFKEFTRLSYRVFLFSYAVFAFYITNSYDTSLFSLLSKPVVEGEIRSLNELYAAIAGKRIRCGTQASTTIFDALQIYQHKVADIIREQMRMYPSLLTDDKRSSLRKIPSEKGCFLYTRNYMKAFMFENGLERDVRVSESDYFYTFIAGMALQKKCHLIHLFNGRLQWLLGSGLWSKWLAEGMMERKIFKITTEPSAVSNSAFIGPYMLFGAGIVLSMIIVSLERIRMRKGGAVRRKNTRRIDKFR